MNRDFFKGNRSKLFSRMANNSLLIMFAGKAPHKSADEAYTFTPNRNFFYLTGLDKPNLILMMSKVNDVENEIIFVEPSDPKLEKWVGKKLDKQTACECSGIEDTAFVGEFHDKLMGLLGNGDITELYLNLERQEWEETKTKSHEFSEEMVCKFPYLRIKNIYPQISALRTIKAPGEIEEVRKAISITKEGILNLMGNARPGMKENELEAYFDFVLTTKGVKDHAFHSIVASGINGAVLHYNDNCCEAADNSLVLLDLGAQWNYYNADISRTFPVNGKFTARQKEIYNIVLKALEETTRMIKPGVPYKELNLKTKEILAEGCIKLGLIKDAEELSRYYYHNVSHYLGLDTHDVGDRSAVLQAGMLVTVEPGLYIEEEGIGIRIEDDVLVTEQGFENLSADIIKTVEEIEAFMAK